MNQPATTPTGPSHDFDPKTSYCNRCGQAEAATERRSLECTSAPNVVSISQRLFYRRVALIRKLMEEQERETLRI